MRLACAAAADAKTRNQVLIFPSAGRSQDKGANCRAIMVGLDSLGAIVLRERVSRGRITSRLANLPPCLIGIEAKVGLSRRGLRVEMRRWRKGLASAFVIR